MTQKQKWDIVIVGGGLAGLSQLIIWLKPICLY